MAMMLIPAAIMTALGVVREKEIGSIMNLYGSPASVLMQFLIGKQIPYILMALLSFTYSLWYRFYTRVARPAARNGALFEWPFVLLGQPPHLAY